jgi:hypothetical protein
VVLVDEPRYRCDSCGNVTRFDVTTSQTTKAFHHYTVGGELEIEEATVLSRHVDEVVCRWCGHGRNVIEIGELDADQLDADQLQPGESGAPSQTP